MNKLFKILFSLFLFVFVSALNAQIIYEYEGSRNLSSSPITVDGLSGDKWDYHFIIFCDSSGSTGNDNLEITLNSDTGSNYDNNYMRGGASTAVGANVSPNENFIKLHRFTKNTSSRNSFAIGLLTGESGDNRKITSTHSQGDPRIYQNDTYWTNTVDEVDEITFTGSVSASYSWHIIVYRTGKITSQNSWQIVDSLSWSSESTEKSFTVDGDQHIQYMVSWEGDKELSVECNNDNAANYTRLRLSNSSGTIQANVSTARSNITLAGTESKFIINAESGVDRLAYISSSKTTANQQEQRAFWWLNTGSNLVSLDLSPSSSAIGKAVLYRRKNPYTTADSLPFQTIKTIDVSGDFSAGETVSGLTLDDYKLVKIEFLGSNTSGNDQLEITFNSITDYYVQRLRGLTSTASASVNASINYITLCQAQNGDQTYGVAYIYPKSGEYRPALTTFMTDEDQISFHANWVEDTASEFTSITIKALTTNSYTGQIRISVLK